MAILWQDGFDLYNGIQTNIGLQSRYVLDSFRTSSSVSNMITGRFGGQAYLISPFGTGSGQDPRITVNFGSSYTQGSFNAAIQVQNLFEYPSSGTAGVTMRIVNGTTRVFEIRIYDTGEIVLANSAGTEIGRSAAGTIVDFSWDYLQLEFTLSTTVGTASLKFNGVDLFTPLTGLNTGQTQWTGFQLWEGGSSVFGDTAWDDLYATDGASLGERRIGTFRPDADTATTDFTPSSGSDNYLMVDDTTCDGDATYVQSNTVGALDLYDIVNLSGTPTAISAVQLVAFALKTDASTRTFNLTAKSGATQSNGSAQTLGSAYKWYGRLLETDPDTSTTWSASAVNSLQIGPRIAS